MSSLGCQEGVERGKRGGFHHVNSDSEVTSCALCVRKKGAGPLRFTMIQPEYTVGREKREGKRHSRPKAVATTTYSVRTITMT